MDVIYSALGSSCQVIDHIMYSDTNHGAGCVMCRQRQLDNGPKERTDTTSRPLAIDLTSSEDRAGTKRLLCVSSRDMREELTFLTSRLRYAQHVDMVSPDRPTLLDSYVRRMTADIQEGDSLVIVLELDPTDTVTCHALEPLKHHKATWIVLSGPPNMLTGYSFKSSRGRIVCDLKTPNFIGFAVLEASLKSLQRALRTRRYRITHYDLMGLVNGITMISSRVGKSHWCSTYFCLPQY